MAKPVNLRMEIFAMLESLDCLWLERDGQVWVLTPQNLLFCFGPPVSMTGTGLSDEVEAWVIQNVHSRD